MMERLANILIIFSMITIIMIGIGFLIYVYVTYANVPFNELPAWVIPFFIRR